MKILKFAALALLVFLFSTNAFTSPNFTSLYWFDASDIYTGRQNTSTNEINYLHTHGYPDIPLNSGCQGELLERGFTALGTGQTEAGINEENIFISPALY